LPTKREAPKAAADVFLPAQVVSTVELSRDPSCIGSNPASPATFSSPSALACPPRDLRDTSTAPLDACFVLPLCETLYGVCVEPLAMCDGEFDILRIAGYPVLHGAVRHSDGLRLLEITCNSLPSKQGQILARVAIQAPTPVAADMETVDLPTTEPQILTVEGVGGKPYGCIRPEAEGSYVLACGQEDVISFTVDDGRQLVVRSIGAKKELAQASWFEQSDFFSGAGHLAIRVNPNEDTVLVVACTLALTILGGDKNVIRFARPAARAG